MKTKITFALFLSALSLTTASAQEEREIEIPSELIVYKNPNVKGIRLDSIVSKKTTQCKIR